MVTKTSKGRITGLLALSLEAQVALEKNDPVIVSGDYECVLADGTKPVLGHVSVANKQQLRGVATRPAEVPGPVTVEALAFYVTEVVAGGAIPAGSGVDYDVNGDLVAVVLGDPYCGIALMEAAAQGDKIDVAFR